jgi:hypothetical protein
MNCPGHPPPQPQTVTGTKGDKKPVNYLYKLLINSNIVFIKCTQVTVLQGFCCFCFARAVVLSEQSLKAFFLARTPIGVFEKLCLFEGFDAH